MEEDESPSNSKHRKNEARISINIGGNIGGLVVLGGAFAVTALIAVFAVKRRRRRRRDCADKEDLLRKKEVKGPRVILQNPSSPFHQNPCLTDGSTGMVAEETQLDSIELDSTESLILEENPASMINVENKNFTSDDPKQEMVIITSCDDCCGGVQEESSSMINDEIENFAGDDQEMLLNDDPKQEMIVASCDDCCGVEELPLQVLDGELMNEVEDKIKNDSTENSSWLERIEIERQEEEVDAERIMEEESKPVSLVEEAEEELERVGGEGEEEEEYEKGHCNEEYVMEEEAVGADKLTAETAVAMHWVEGEEEEGSSEEYVMDESNESSEGTGSPSTETNAEAIWPAESIDFLSLELKNTKLNTQSSGEKIVEEDGSTRTEEFEDKMEALPLEVRYTSVNLQHAESKEKNVEEDGSNKTEQFGDFINSKSTIPGNDTDNYESSKILMSIKKKEMPELVEVNNRTAESTRRKIWVCSVFLLAFLLLLLFSHRNALSYHVVNGNSFCVHEF